MVGTVGGMQDVIFFTARRGGVAAVLKQMAALRLAVHTARTPSEVIWLLASEQRFSAVFVDGDAPAIAIVELLSHVVPNHGHVKRFLVMTAPAITEMAGCIVLDKERLGNPLPLSEVTTTP